MKLEGSCHCGAVSFSATTHAPHPYMNCYCSICRKLGGGGGYAINIKADYDSLKIKGVGSALAGDVSPQCLLHRHPLTDTTRAQSYLR